jgi:hypothetical protein
MDRERKCEDFTKAPICLRASSTYGCRLLDAVFANGRQRTPTKSYSGAPVRIKLRTPILLRFRCNFVRLKDHLQLLNVPEICASHGQATAASSTLPALSSGLERTTPSTTIRRNQTTCNQNEIFGRTNPISERSRRRANCARAFVAGPAVFPLYFQRADWRSRGRAGPAMTAMRPAGSRSRGSYYCKCQGDDARLETYSKWNPLNCPRAEPSRRP